VLELASIRDAIARRLGRFDLGTGDYRYKHELGGAVERRYSVIAASPTLPGRASAAAARSAAVLRERVRPRARARRLALRVRGALPWT